MAMIKCPECGQPISSNALSCPHCGTPIKMKREIPVRFFRKGKLVGSGVKILLKLDGMFIGILTNNDSKTINVSQGAHQLDIETEGIIASEARHVTCAITVPYDARKMEIEVATGFLGPAIKNITSS